MKHASLTGEEIADRQAHIDHLENLGRAAASHHETHSTPGSHYSHHHSKVADVVGILERAAQKR